MREAVPLALALAAGLGLGALFFGGLWWTVHKGVSSRRPALWFFPSLVLRTGVVLAGFFVVAGGQWRRLLLCVLGFFIAHRVVARLGRPSGELPTPQVRKAAHASQPR